MPSASTLLEQENALLGSIIEDLRRGGARDSGGALEQRLAATEDALLDMHSECKAIRGELRAEKESLRKAHAHLEECRRAALSFHEQLRAEVANHRATRRVLVAELALLERQWLGATDRTYVARLRAAADDAVRGMHDAQAECRWLHGQLQAVLRDGGAAARAAAVVADDARQQSDGDMPEGTGTLQLHLTAAASSTRPAAGPLSLAPSPSDTEAMRTANVRAVQRCHELQGHMARMADEGDRLRPQLASALGRVSGLQAENDALRVALAHGSMPAALEAVAPAASGHNVESSTASPYRPRDAEASWAAASLPLGGAMSTAASLPQAGVGPPSRITEELTSLSPLPPPFMHTSSGGAPGGAPCSAAPSQRGMRGGGGMRGPRGGDVGLATDASGTLRSTVVKLRSQVSHLERELAHRRSAHHSDLEALCEAHRDAAESARTLQSERSWVASLDQMRVADLQTIQSLEARLRQWGVWHGDEAASSEVVEGGLVVEPATALVATLPRSGDGP